MACGGCGHRYVPVSPGPRIVTPRVSRYGFRRGIRKAVTPVVTSTPPQPASTSEIPTVSTPTVEPEKKSE